MRLILAFADLRALCIALGLMSCMPTASAAIKALSRANCIGFVNESVTYDRPGLIPFVGSSASTHIPQGQISPKHVLGAPNNGGFFWRFYAGDTSDSERMLVRGYHTWLIQTGGGSLPIVWVEGTAAVDCNLSEW